MRKSTLTKFLFGFLALLLVFSADSYAQVTVTVGTGTSTDDNYGPIYRSSSSSSFDYSRHSYLFLPGELGIAAGSSITELAWFKDNGFETNGGASFKIYLENVSATTLTTGTAWTAITASATEVYNNSAQMLTTATGFIPFTITPFVYTGGALQVSVDWDISAVAGSPTTGSFFWRYTSAPDLAIGFASSSAPATLNTSTYGNSRPNTRIAYNPPPSNNAGVTAIISPAQVLTTGSPTDIDVTIRNFGGSPITGVNVYASVYNQNTMITNIVGPYPYAGPTLAVGATSDTLTIGNFTFSAGTYTICAYTDLPNGGVDADQSNDTLCTVGCTPLPGGLYTINSGAATGGSNFNNFNDLANLMATCGIGGAITVNVTPASGPYNEQVVFGSIPGSSATNTVTINGNGETISFGATVSAERHTIRLDGTDHFTINNLVIEATGTSFGFPLHMTNGNDSCSITNNTIVNTSTTSSSSSINGLTISGSTTSIFTEENNGITGTLISGNTITGGYAGISCYIETFTPTLATPGVRILNNTISETYQYGMYMFGLDGAVVSGNSIQTRSSGSFTNFADGMYCDNFQNDFFISKNIISNVGDYGIFLTQVNDLAAGPRAEVSNNCIGGGFRSTSTAVGIYCSDCNDIDIFHNSVLVDGGTTTFGRGLYITSFSQQNLDVRNNSFSNIAGGVAMEVDAADTTVFLDLNHNNYHSTGAYIVDWLNQDLPDLDSLQSPTLLLSGTQMHDDRSRSVNPGYVSTTFPYDLHAQSAALDKGGDDGTGVLDDIDGDTRDPIRPDMGYDEFTPLATDYGVTAVLSPVSGCGLSSSETVTIEIVNNGSSPKAPGTMINVNFTVNGGSLITEVFTLTGSLPSAGTALYTFTAGANLSATGAYTIAAFTSSDANTSNDTSSITVEHFVPFGQPYFETIDTFPTSTSTPVNSGGWVATSTGSFNWFIDDFTTGSSGTGPNNDHTTGTDGNYFYTEASSGTFGDVATVTSPCIDLNPLAVPALRYWYHMYGSDINLLQVQVNGGSGWVQVDSIVGQQQTGNGDAWLSHEVDLSAFAGQVVGVRFLVTRGTSFAGDVSIDDIQFFDAGDPEIGVSSVDAPEAELCDGSTTEPITISLFNNSALPQTGFAVTYTVVGPISASVTETYPDTIPIFGTATYTFATPANLSATGDYTITAWTFAALDPNNSNDTSSTMVNNAIAPGAPLSTTNDTVVYTGSPVSGTLTAVSSADGIIWYDAATGGNIVGAGDTFITPPVASKTSFYAASYTGVGFCPTGSAAHLVSITLGSFDEEIHWDIIDGSSTVVASRPCAYYAGNLFGATLNDTICLITGQPYTFRAFDDFGDSWNGGTYSVSDASGNLLANNGGASPTNGTGGDNSATCNGSDLETSEAFTGGSGDFVQIRCESAGRLVAIVCPDTVDNEILVSEIITPTTGCGLTANEDVTVVITNNGDQPQTGFPVSFQVDTQTVVTETYTATLAASSSDTFTFAAGADLSMIGLHTIISYTSLAGDYDTSNDTSTTTVNSILNVTSYPYSESFETPAHSWQSGGTLNSWALGTPAKSVIIGASVDSTAWVTGGLTTGTYNANEASFVQGPCFDFSSLSVPVIELDVWWNSEFSWDGAQLQASTDLGATWTKVGALGDPDNWYTDGTINGLVNAGQNGEGWSGRTSSSNGSNGYVTAKHILDGLGGQSQVFLRVFFGADGSVQDNGFAFDNVNIYELPSNDVGVASLDAPLPSCGLGTESITVTLINAGGAPSSTFDVSYEVTGPVNSGLVTQTYSTPIPALSSVPFTFTTPADFSAAGVYTVVVYTSLPGDVNTTNDTISVSIAGKLALPTLETFETGFTIGSQGTWSFNNWAASILSGTVPGWNIEDATGANENSSGTGPFWDHTTFGTAGGVYIYTETSGGSLGNEASLVTPCIDLSGAILPAMDFWYHMYGTNMGNLSVDIDTGNGVWINNITPSIIGQQQTAGSDPWIQRLVDLSPYSGKTVRVRFRGARGSSFDSDMSIDDVRFFDGGIPDIGVTSVDSPTDSCVLSNAETVNVTVSNFGLLDIASYSVTYSVSGAINSGPFTQTVTDTLFGSSSATVTFTNTADFSAAGNYTVTAYTTLAGDASAANDTTTTVVATATPIPVTENFETFVVGSPGTLLNGWTTNPSTGFRWEVEDATGANENSFNTGPFFDHTTPATAGGVYLYTESSSGATGAVAELTSPCIDLSGITYPVLNFWYHMFGADMGELHVDINAGGGWILDVAAPLIGQQQDSGSAVWKKKLVPLASYAGQVVQIRFRGIRGTGFTSDMSLDDVAIIDGSTLPKDLAILSITTPVSGCGLTNAEKLRVVIENQGGSLIQGFFIKARVLGPINTGNINTNIPVATPIPPFGKITYTFPPNVNMSLPGSYNILVVLAPDAIKNPNPDNDTIGTVVRNIKNVATFPYNESFETNDGGWFSGGSGSTWAYGSPNKTIINSASDGSKAWVNGGIDTNFLNINGEVSTYNPNEDSYVQGPCFDMSNLQSAEFTMDIWYETEFSWDGANLQTSIDEGATWQLVGALNDPDNWYNDGTITGAPGGSQIGWSGSTGGWVSTRHVLDGMAGEPRVFLRINFGSDGSVQSAYNGFAFDKMRIREEPPLDVAAIAITSPETDCGQDTASVSILIGNLGNNPLLTGQTMDASYTVNNGAAVTETLSVPFNVSKGGSFPYSFSTPVVFPDTGDYLITAWTTAIGDGDTTNDTTSTTIINLFIPDAPIVQNDTICQGGGLASLVATGNGDYIFWYDSASGGNRVFIGDTFNVLVNGDTTFYAEASTQAPGGEVSSTFASNNGCQGNFFDLNSIIPLTIDSFAVNIDAGSQAVSVYYKEGTAFGSETNAGAWILAGTATVTSAGINNPTVVPIGGINLDANTTYGIMVSTDGGNFINYTNLIAGTNDFFTNGEVSLTMGTSFCSPLWSSPIAGRVWNGSIFYGGAGCFSTRTAVQATVAPSIVTSIVGSNVTTFGGSDGSADLTVSGGIAPYTFFWSTFDATEDVTNLVAGKYFVTVTDKAGCTAVDSVVITQPTGCDPAVKPTGLSVTDIKTSTATLNWAPLLNTVSWEIRGNQTGFPFNITINVGGGQTSKGVSALRSNKSYSWQIRGRCNAGGTITTDWSDINTFVTLPCATPPTNLFANPVTHNAARLNFTPVFGVDAYRITGSVVGSSTIAVVNVNSGTATFKDVFNLVPNTCYRWLMRSICGTIDQSGFSAIDTFCTLPAPPSAPKTTAELSNEFEVGDAWVELYPNPAKDFVNVEIAGTNSGEAISIRVFDVTGKEVFTRDLTGEDLVTDTRINLERWADGYYQVVASGDNFKQVRKLIVTH